MLAPPIVPGRYQPSIFGTNELNFRVRNGNGCTLTVIGTNLKSSRDSGDPCGNRTHVNGVRGRCLNRLTNGPYHTQVSRLLPFGAPSGIRTRDTLIKSQVLYQLS